MKINIDLEPLNPGITTTIKDNLKIIESDLKLSSEKFFPKALVNRKIQEIEKEYRNLLNNPLVKENIREIVNNPLLIDKTLEDTDRYTAQNLIEKSLDLEHLNLLDRPLVEESLREIAQRQLISQTLKETLANLSQNLIEKLIDTPSDSPILETLIEAKNKPQKPHNPPPTEPRLFSNKNPKTLPTALVIASGMRAQLQSMGWKKDERGIAFFEYLGNQSGQIIEHYISQSSASGDISLLPWDEAKQIIDKFNFTTAKLHLLFAAHCMKQQKPWVRKFTLKATDIVKDIGLDKRTDRPKNELFKEIASAAFALDCLLVKAEWEVGNEKRGKIPVKVNISRLWNVNFEYYGKKNKLKGKVDKPDEIYITVMPGQWTESFLNYGGSLARLALFQFGYIARQVFTINPYHDELALRLALHLTIESRYHQSGRYKVETLLKKVLLGAESTLASSRNDRRYAQKLKNQWKKALKLLEKLGWQISYDRETYPRVLQHNSTERCPKGYLEKLLAATITILPPDPIPALIATIANSPPRKASPKLLNKTPNSLITPQDILKARKAKKWSQRELAEFMGITQPLVSLMERGKHTPTRTQERKLRKLLNIED